MFKCHDKLNTKQSRKDVDLIIKEFDSIIKNEQIKFDIDNVFGIITDDCKEKIKIAQESEDWLEKLKFKVIEMNLEE